MVNPELASHGLSLAFRPLNMLGRCEAAKRRQGYESARYSPERAKEPRLRPRDYPIQQHHVRGNNYALPRLAPCPRATRRRCIPPFDSSI